jgi:uncharacterized protein (DUF58 family)
LTSVYPSRRAVFAVALGIPLSLAAALAAPGLWAAGVAWSVLAVLLMGLDWLLGASARRLSVNSDLPDMLGVGRTGAANFALIFGGRTPALLEADLDGNERFSISPTRQMLAPEGDRIAAAFQLTPLRRGEGRLETLWLRWTGPLGLTWIQHAHSLATCKVCAKRRCACFNATTMPGCSSSLSAGAGPSSMPCAISNWGTIRVSSTGSNRPATTV